MSDENARYLLLPNELGDIEITWDASSDEHMRKVIEEKMKQGVIFYTFEPVLGIKALLRKKTIKDVKDIKLNAIRVAEPSVASLLEQGKASAVRSGTSQQFTGTPTVTRKAADVVRKPSVGFRAVSGG